MVREIKGKYFIAAFITAAIFLLGMLFGMVIEGKRSDLLNGVVEEQKLFFGSLQLQYQLISEFEQQKNCPAVSATFEEYVKELVKAQERLDKYEKDSTGINKENFLMLKQEYTQAEINYWLLARKTKELCDRDFVTILFFYAPEEQCVYCNEQSFVLTYLKELLKEKVLIFSFDATLEKEPLIKMLINIYNIKNYPAIVVDGKPFEGLQDRDFILKLVCKEFKEKPKVCQ
ncbi:MAG: hypothetical protein QXG86_00205 [Candidatus Woesearchaeota archaeon]